MEWVFEWPNCCEGVLHIGGTEPARRDPANPDGPPLPARERQKCHFFQGFYRTQDEGVARLLCANEATQHGMQLKSGPPFKRWEPKAWGAPMAANSAASDPSSFQGFAGIAARLPFLPIDGDLDGDFDAFHDPAAVEITQ